MIAERCTSPRLNSAATLPELSMVAVPSFLEQCSSRVSVAETEIIMKNKDESSIGAVNSCYWCIDNRSRNYCHYNLSILHIGED